MKIEIRYQSKSGNTEKVAQAIAKKLGIGARSVQTPLPEPVDVLFLGGAIYAGGINRDLKKFLKALGPGQAKNIVLFSTAMGTKNIRAKAEKLLAGKGAALYGEEFHAQAAELDAALPKAEAFAEGAVAKLGAQA